MDKTNENFKKNRGITLIALIITIIVMLILVTVIITSTINGELFNKAGQAKIETDNAIETENRLSSGMITIVGQGEFDIDSYVNSIVSSNQNTAVNNMVSSEPSTEPTTLTFSENFFSSLGTGGSIGLYEDVSSTSPVRTFDSANTYIISENTLGMILRGRTGCKGVSINNTFSIPPFTDIFVELNTDYFGRSINIDCFGEEFYEINFQQNVPTGINSEQILFESSSGKDFNYSNQNFINASTVISFSTVGEEPDNNQYFYFLDENNEQLAVCGPYDAFFANDYEINISDVLSSSDLSNVAKIIIDY